MARKTPPPKPTTVLLVRHGKTPTTGQSLPGRAPGLHLADDGVRQAERAAERIAELTKVDAVYCSPLERTRETAKPIGAALGLKPKVERGLLECDFGDWTGARAAKICSSCPSGAPSRRHRRQFRFPNGESFTEMQVRMVGTIEQLTQQHPGGTIVCVSHADPIKAAMAHALGTHIDLFQRIVISTCSISAVSYTTGGPVVLAVNSTGGSLEELAPS